MEVLINFRKIVATTGSMPKYLQKRVGKILNLSIMKKFAIGIFAVAFAVMGFAFTTEEKAQTTYIWFEVKPGLNIDCDDYASVTLDQLVLPAFVPGQAPLTTLTNLNRVSTRSAAVTTFTCPSNVILCAVAYPNSSSNIEVIEDEFGNDVIAPKIPSVNEVEKVCKP